MRVSDVMTENPAVCTPGVSLIEVARLMVENDCGAIPVVSDERSMRPIGVITDRDIVCRALAAGKDPTRLRVVDCMSQPCVTVSPDASLDDACDMMEASQVRRIVVVDEEHRCCGIVAQADIAALGDDEATAEVVREISRTSYEPDALR